MIQFSPSRYAGIRVVVLGASGFIGRWTARVLCQQGADVCLAVRDAAVAAPIFAAYDIAGDVVELNLGEETAVTNLIAQYRPAITFNLAGYGVDRSERDETTAYQINAYLLQTLAEAVASHPHPNWGGQQIIHVGSALEYGVLGNDLVEDSTPQPTTLYGQSKLAGTQILQQFAANGRVKAITARLFTIYGVGEHNGRLLPSLLTVARTNQPLPMTAGLQKRDFTYVADVVEGLLRLGLLPDTQADNIVNLATGKLTTVRTFVETAATVLNIPPANLQFGALPTRAEEMEHAPISISRLKQWLNWVPAITIAEGVQDTAVFPAHDQR
ncbi:MAG: NAD(P)-dependent oxidoreductase [Chloroflexi bacterium]|nr:NAD(P)-dependent oxidoreductase [Chloroflexota bacterium]